MGNRFYYGMPATQAFQAMNAMDDDTQARVSAAAASASAAAGSAAGAASSATAAGVARDAAIAAWQASTAPAEQLAALSKQFHSGAIVDAFLYDTSKDSDGGAWRKRCKHTSWESETLAPGKWLGLCAGYGDAFSKGGVAGDYFQNTGGQFLQLTTPQAGGFEIWRGNTREFPAIALIVVETGRLVIYDATQPTLPMWMSIAGLSTGEIIARALPSGGFTCVRALNGSIFVSASDSGTWWGGVWQVSMLADRASRYMRNGSINTGLFVKPSPLAQRHTTETFVKVSANTIVALSCNGVAVTVLPDAPVDPATGLPTPTIAAATAGGVSVIKQDGTAVNSAFTGNSTLVEFSASTLYFTRNSAAEGFNAVPIVGIAASFSGTAYTNATVPATGMTSRTRWAKTYVANGGATLLTLLKENPATPVKGMVAAITNAYNSGWQVGDSRGAWLADTAAEVVTGTEMVTNGTFATDLSGWQTIVGGTSTVTWVGGAAQVSADGTNSAYLTQGFATTIGKAYSVTFTTGGGQALFIVGSSATNGSVISTALLNPGTYTYTFIAATSWTYIGWTRTAAVTFTVDNVSIKPADADRSVKGKGLIVNGSVTKAAVAAGAQLVGYSGFSIANYLEQPYNSDMDFGTGDFCVMGWANVTSTAGQYLFSRGSGGAGLIALAISTNWLTICHATGTSVDTGIPVALGLHHLVLVRIGGVLQLWVDSVMVWSAANTQNVTNAAAVMNLGILYTHAIPFLGTLALWRASATAPSADQIAQIYRDELVLFQAGAPCTLDGASNAVTALAYDDMADLLHVGTSWGRTTFKGLKRVESEATSVGAITSLTAGGGAYITGGAAAARYYQPAIGFREELRRKAEARQAMAREEIPFDFDGIAAQTAFALPLGFNAKNVFVAGAKKRLGSTKDYTVTYDGYRYTVNFGVSPGATWVQITANWSI